MTHMQPVRPSLYATRPELAEENGVTEERSDEEEGSEDEDEDWIDGMLDEEDETAARAKEIDLFGPSDDEEPSSSNPVSGPLEEPITCVPCDEEHVPKTLHPPIKPSAQAVAKHECTHIPYRSWCPVCTAAKMKEDGYFRIKN